MIRAVQPPGGLESLNGFVKVSPFQFLAAGFQQRLDFRPQYPIPELFLNRFPQTMRGPIPRIQLQDFRHQPVGLFQFLLLKQFHRLRG